MKKQRPIYLDLTQIKLPVAALASILHRISGIIMFFAIGILLWMLQQSLLSAESFSKLQILLTGFTAQFICWGILTALTYHIIAGVRHLMMDAGYFENLVSGSLSAKVSMGLAIIVFYLECGYGAKYFSVGRNGIHDYLIVRVSAVIMATYSLYLLWFLMTTPSISYAQWSHFFQTPVMKVGSTLALIALLLHAWIGTWQVLTDYVKPAILRGCLQVVRIITLWVYVIFGNMLIWGM